MNIKVNENKSTTEQIPQKRSGFGEIVPEFASREQSDVPKKKELPKFPTTLIPLPTKGWFYPQGHSLAEGYAEAKQLTAAEEDLLTDPDLLKNNKMLDKLFETLLVDKTLKVNEILLPDKNAILVGIRRLAYGDTYEVDGLPCPSCGEKNKVSINLSEIKDKPFDFDSHLKGLNSFEFKLPSSGVVVSYKLFNSNDEVAIENEVKAMKKLSGQTKSLTTSLIRCLISVNNNEDKGAIRKFVNEELLARDSVALRKHIRDNTPSLDMTFDFVCKSCGYEERMDIPIGMGFLYPMFEAGR